MTDDLAEPAAHEAPPVENEPFAARRLEGRGGGWAHIGGAGLTYILAQIAAVPLILVAALLGFPKALEIITSRVNWVELTPEQDGAALAACALILLALVLLLLVNWLVVRIVHHRPLMSILTAHERFQWRSALISFGVYTGVMLAVSAVLSTLGIGSEAQIVFDPQRFFPFLALVLILTPFQALAEEAFVRGYLYQGISAFTASTIVRIGLPALLFLAMHSANSDFREGGLWAFLIYFIFGAYFGLLTVKTAGVEAATGAHTANNIFAFSISTSSGAGMPFATIFYEPVPDYRAALFMIILVVLLHYIVFFKMFKS